MSIVEAAVDPTGLGELAAKLRAIDGGPVALLERGLQAMADGDFTVSVDAHADPIELSGADAHTRELIDLLNVMLQRTHAALSAYEALRRELAVSLGDRSCLPELLAALNSLNDHCLTDLDGGLQAIADGDLTHDAHPVTRPLRARSGDALGTLGDVFNDMLARSRTALRSYDAVREDLRVALGDSSCLDDLRQGLQSLQRHCLRDLEEGLEALAEDTTLTRTIAPSTSPIITTPGAQPGELAALFNRALLRAQASVRHLAVAREPGPVRSRRPGAA